MIETGFLSPKILAQPHGRAFFIGDEHDISRRVRLPIKDEYFEKV